MRLYNFSMSYLILLKINDPFPYRNTRKITKLFLKNKYGIRNNQTFLIKYFTDTNHNTIIMSLHFKCFHSVVARVNLKLRIFFH